MRSILFLLSILQFSITALSQSVSCDLFLSNAHFEDLSNTAIDANAISYNQLVKMKVTIANGSPSNDAPAGHFKVKIGLGSGLILHSGFDLATAPLSSYFNWSYDLSGAQPQIVGTSIAALPADFTGEASFELEASAAGPSTASFNFLISNPIGTATPLSDPLPDNNVAATGYVVASAISFSTVTKNVSCFGAGNGTITITASGGIPNPSYSFTLLNTVTNVTATNSTGAFTGLGPGNYNITVADAFGNSNTASATITQPAALTLAVAATNVSCNGAANGSISISDTSRETVTIKKEGIGNDLAGQTSFAPGTYVITAAAADGNATGYCTRDTTVVISEPLQVAVYVVATNVSCKDAANGTIIATASAGAGIMVNGSPYVAGALYTPGIYHIVASAPNGNLTGFCTKDTTITITEPTAVTITAIKTNVSCNGQADGTIVASASAGATITINGMAYNSSAQYGPGSYHVVATANGGNSGQVCTKDTTVLITEPMSVALSVVATNVSCNGAANGTITISGSAGAVYTISKDGVGADLSSQSYFVPGTYLVTASIANGNGNGFCTKDTTVSITQPAVLSNVFVSKTNNSCHGGNTGTIKVSASGGTPSYIYTISGPTVNTTGASTGIFTGLVAGTYSITATDANGCTATVLSITLTEPPGTKPDVILSVADYTDNFFPSNATEVTLIYQVTEIGGNPALNDILRITKQAGYSFSLPALSTVTVGSGSNAIAYPVDNSRWTVDNTDPIFYKVSLGSGQITCGQSVYLAIKLSRATPNKSVFTLTSVIQNVTGETQTNNNSTTVVLVGQ